MLSSFLSKETTRWQGLGLKPPTFRSEVQGANHYTTAPPPLSIQNRKFPCAFVYCTYPSTFFVFAVKG